MTESHFPAIGSMALPPNWPNRTIVGDPHEIRERVTMGETMTQAHEIASTAINRRGITTEARRSRWLSIREIAADLGVSSSTSYKWSARGAP